MPYQRKYDFQPGTKISSSQVDEEFNNLINAVNANEDALDQRYTKLEADGKFPDKQQEDLIPMVLQSGWLNYQAGQEGYYYKDSFGRVHLSGRFKNGSSTDSALLATLPVGYRPLKDMFFDARNCNLLLAADGTLRLYSVSNSGDIGVDGKSFRAQ